MKNISICIITKNECERLERCLRAAKNTGFELVVVDTGSNDGTVEMAKKYTDSVYFFEWIADFAAAKNFAASKAINDMVFILDSDEYLRPLDSVLLDRICTRIWTQREHVGRMRRINQVQQKNGQTEYTDFTNRIFDRRKYCFKGAIHEQLVRGNVFTGPDSADEIYEIYEAGFIADHDGYVGTPEQIKAKANRNASMLLKELEENPEDIYLLYQAGKAYFLAEDFEKSAYYLGKALEYEVEPELEYVIDLVETYGYALLESDRADVAILLESVEQEFGNSSDFRFMMGLVYMNNALFEKAIDSFLKATKVGKGKMKGVDSYMAYYNIGVVYECLGELSKAREFYEQCGDYEPAIKRLNS